MIYNSCNLVCCGIGIGKTVTGAAIVRDPEIRLFFDQIIWVPLGQSPVIEKIQNLTMMQLTGESLYCHVDMMLFRFTLRQ